MLGVSARYMKLLSIYLLLIVASDAAEPKIVFNNHPEVGIPREAKLHEKVDPKSHGTLKQILGDSIDTAAVRYFSDVWSNQKQVSDYLAELLSDERTEVYTFQIWSQMVAEPEIECLLTFKEHQQGKLLIWGTVACVRDSTGKWWFVSLYDYYHRKHPKGERDLVRKTPKPQ